MVLKKALKWFLGKPEETGDTDLWSESPDEPPTAYGRVGVCRECRRIIKDVDRWGDGACKECEG